MSVKLGRLVEAFRAQMKTEKHILHGNPIYSLLNASHGYARKMMELRKKSLERQGFK